MDWQPNPHIASLTSSPSSSNAEHAGMVDESPSNEDTNLPTEVQFDKNLPATHSYLPGGLDVMHGRSILEAGWKGTVPCIAHPQIAFPGEFLPMIIPNIHNMFKTIMGGNRFIGLIFAESGGNYISQFGTLCEMLEVTHNEEPVVNNRVIIKSRTRYRFRILNDVKNFPMPGQGNLTFWKFNIEILPDVVTEGPVNNTEFFSLGRYKSCPDTNLNKLLHIAESLMTPLPSFVFKTLDIRKIVTEIKTYFQFENNIRKIPEDLISMSFWVATHIAVSSKERLALLKVDNALLRLYMAAHHMRKIHSLSCNICRAFISRKNYYLPMSSEGLTAKYCNVGGYIHDILTVEKARNIRTHGQPSMEFTWFPGYYWTILLCSKCHHHIGWRFDAENASLRPKSFYGLIRNMLVPTKNDDDEDGEEDEVLDGVD